MRMILSGMSACEWYRYPPNAFMARRPMPAGRLPSDAYFDDAQSQKVHALQCGVVSTPIEALVCNARYRGRTEAAARFTTGTFLPDGALQHIGESLYIVSPEYLFLQAAGKISLVQLVQLGFELCGRYSLFLSAHHDERTAFF